MLYSPPQVILPDSVSVSIAILSVLVAVCAGQSSYGYYHSLINLPRKPVFPPLAHGIAYGPLQVFKRVREEVLQAIAQWFGFGQAVFDAKTLAAERRQQQLMARWHDLRAIALQQQEAIEDMHQQIQHLKGQLLQTEKLAGLGQLVAGVAHDIKNPLGFIQANAIFAEQYVEEIMMTLELAQTLPRTAPGQLTAQLNATDWSELRRELPETLAAIQVGVDQIQQITGTLTTYARSDGDHAPAELSALIDKALLILRHRLVSAGQPPIQITATCTALPLVTCAAGQINQVMVNIVANAIDALREAAVPQPTIHIHAHPLDAQWVRIAIADNGPGLPAGKQSQIYDPFFTTKPSGQGTGLGLAISRQIIADYHGGRLHNASSHCGTTFYIDLPVAPTATSAAAA